MKNFLKNMASAAALLFAMTLPMSLAAYDGSFPFIVINKIGAEKKISLIMRDLKSPATYRLGNNTQGTLLEETIDDAEFAKIFNLQALEDGTYTFSVLTGVREVEQSFVIKGNELILNTVDRKEFYVPTILQHDDHVDLVMFSNELTKLQIEIQDENGNKVFNEELNNVVKVEKRFNLSKLAKGQYTFIVSTPNKTYMKEIRRK
jgi:hypothetical protein